MALPALNLCLGIAMFGKEFLRPAIKSQTAPGQNKSQTGFMEKRDVAAVRTFSGQLPCTLHAELTVAYVHPDLNSKSEPPL